MNKGLQSAILSALQADDSETIAAISSVSGGDINQAAKFEVGGKSYFVKWNSNTKYPRMFDLEAKALAALSEPNSISIANVVATGESREEAFLILDWIEQGKASPDFWESFGTQLAALHRQTNETFGWEDDNYIGSLFQSNDPAEDWIDFFIVNRVDIQLEMAFNKGLFHQSTSRAFNKLYPKLEGLIPKEPPALIHGDLWSGNYLVSPEGNPVLIDPAIYYGHREMDIAMMHLFGGFNPQVFQSYNQHFPLQEGWQDRLGIHQLYPLLVHVNLFGQAYVGQVESVLKRFV